MLRLVLPRLVSAVFSLQLHVLQLFYVPDHDGPRSVAGIDRSGGGDKLSNERHQLGALIRIRHLVGDGEVDIARPGQNDEWRTASCAGECTVEIEVGSCRLMVLNGTCDVPYQPLHRCFVLGWRSDSQC